jgi:hypothetical protein
VSSPQSHIPPLEVRERAICMCFDGGPCTSYAPGHALHLIQARLAAATPSDWVDGIVEEADAATGVVVVTSFVDGTAHTVWNGAGAAARVEVGSPVALHARYDVLAAGSARFNVAPLRAA